MICGGQLPSLFYCNQQSAFIRGSILGRDNRFLLFSRMFTPALVATLPTVRAILRNSPVRAVLRNSPVRVLLRNSTVRALLRNSPRDQSDSCLEMTTNVHIIPISSIRGATLPLPHMPSWCIQGQVYLSHFRSTYKML